MKTKIAIAMGITGLAALTLIAGPSVTVQVPAPSVTVQVPAPAVTVEVAPDFYVWDGVEFVGVIGTQYYYLGPGNVWIVCDPVRIERFHGWEKGHADWRDHAIHNELYRAHGHDGGSAASPGKSHGKDK